MKLYALFAACGATLSASAIVFPLEWNVNYPVETPYEVEISPAKLGESSFTVLADEVPLETVVLRGKQLGSVDLRFKVPAGTKGLKVSTDGDVRCPSVCSTDGDVRCPSEPTTNSQPLITNLFAGALADPKRWHIDGSRKGQKTNVEVTKLAAGGLRFDNRGATVFARCEVAVPAELRGQPVKLELDCVSRTPMTWGGRIWFSQFDARGRELPENLSDPRWTSHMRPQDRVTDYRERGRIHPQAAKITVNIELRYNEVKIDNYGLPLKDKRDLQPILELTRLTVRPAAELPFPKYADRNFAAGVSGEEGDCAIRLGGERAFWYQTRSHASWAQGVQLREESQLFFPSAAGTVEAWFKPSEFSPSGLVYLLEASHHGAKKATSVKGKASRNNEALKTIVGVAYAPKTKQISVELKDYAEKVFKGSAKWEMPVGRWTHLALCWQPGGEAALFADGKRLVTVPLKDYVPFDLLKSELPNSFGACEFYLGSTWRSARLNETKNDRFPFFEGEADALRVSSVPRYTADFTPAKTFVCDADTRALFTFDRSFDGVSGGGIGWINGTWRDVVDRVEHVLEVEGERVKGERVKGERVKNLIQYWAKEIQPEMDPTKVLDINNYPVLPTDADYAASRVFKSRTATMKQGDEFKITAPKGVYTEFVEFANETDGVIEFPALIRKGEIDPRSFGDIADSLIAKENLSDRERANRVFQFVVGASDYFMNHQPIFDPGSDSPRSVEYEALVMLNGYCGFECGPLNNLAANMFACAGRCPAGQTAGYGHSFEQVFYEGKNHIYDLSAQQFFTAMDNETAAYLEEDAQQPGSHYRIGKSADHFIRLSNRAYYVQNPAFQKKVAMSLNPGERFRMWFMNDGACNDLQHNSCFPGNRRLAPSGRKHEDLEPYEEDYTVQTHAKIDLSKTSKGGLPTTLTRIDRFFPHYSNGYLVFRGRPTAANPAFVNADGSSFCYKVESAYPIVAAEYYARRADGSAAKLELCTDWKEYRPLALDERGVARLDYLVRARMAYWIRVKAPIAEIAEFGASTEVMANTRIFPGKLVAGENEMVFKCEGGRSKVTLGWSEPSKPIEFVGALRSGTIPGMERFIIALDPLEGAKTIEVRGVSSAAKAVCSAGLTAELVDGRLTLTPRHQKGSLEFVTVCDPLLGQRTSSSVDSADDESRKELTVIVAPSVKLITAERAKLSGGAALSRKGQPSVILRKKQDKAVFEVSGVGEGEWCLWNLTRWASHSKEHKARPLMVTTDKTQAISAAGPLNTGLQFYKAHYGREGERAQWKWDHVVSPRSYYPYPLIHRMALGGVSKIEFALREDVSSDVELAAVLVMPFPDQTFKCELKKALGGFNYAPWRMR